MQQYLLVDGKNLLFRAGFANRNLKTSDGRYSGAAHGFLKMLSRIRYQHPSAELVILWEKAGEKTYRHVIYPGYKDRSKKNGEEMDAATSGIHDQIDVVTSICKTVGLRWVRVPKIEADDLAGVIGVELVRRGHEVLLLSGDRDWWQLAAVPGITVVCEQGTGKGTPTLTDERVYDEFECKAKELLRFRPFVGDTSDKIPPVRPRFLKKLALKLVRAGADPRTSFSEQNERVKSLAPGLAEIWPNYQRNYNLMRIARLPADCGIDQLTFDNLMEQVTGDRPEKNYREMLRLLADWELNDALSKRSQIFSVALPVA